MRPIEDGRPGDLYNVRPIGELVPDPDMQLRPGYGFSCTAARIVAVVERNVGMSEHEMIKANAKYAAWDDGTPIYTPDGYGLPSPDHPSEATAEFMREALGRWPSIRG